MLRKKQIHKNQESEAIESNSGRADGRAQRERGRDATGAT
jgi:hypothetical protein